MKIRNRGLTCRFGVMVACAITVISGLTASPADAYQIGPDLRFTNSALGTYTDALGNAPSPWTDSVIVGNGSNAVVYNSTTKQSGWPTPYSWSANALAMTSVADGKNDVARVQFSYGNAYPGDNLYIGFAFCVPQSTVAALPAYNGNPGMYLMVSQLFGSPWMSGSPIQLSLFKLNGNLWVYEHNNSQNPTTNYIFGAQIQPNTWVRVVEHIVVSMHPVTTTINGVTTPGGLSELWVNGTKLIASSLPTTTASNYDTSGASESADHTTVYMATENTDMTSGERIYIDNYRSAINPTFSVPPTITVFNAGMRIGSTYSDVAPTATS